MVGAPSTAQTAFASPWYPMRHGIPQDLMALDEEKFIAMMQTHLGIGIGGGGGGDGADSDRLRSSHLRTLPHR